MRVSTVVVNWNTRDLLEDCLKSIYPPTGALSEIIVVDNASEDGSLEMVKKSFSKVKLLKNLANLGFAKGNNLGASICRGDFIFFLNSDTITSRETIELLADFLRQHNEVGAVSPLILNQDGSIQVDPCYLRFPSLLTTLLYYNKLLRKITFKFFPQILLSTIVFTKPQVIDQCSGAALMIRKSLFEKVGGFDESFPHYFEDTNLSYCLHKLGYKRMFVPQAKVTHLGGKSIELVIKDEGLDRFYLLNFGSLFLFCQKSYSPVKAFLIKLIIFAHLLSTFKFSLIKKLLAQ